MGLLQEVCYLFVCSRLESLVTLLNNVIHCAFDASLSGKTGNPISGFTRQFLFLEWGTSFRDCRCGTKIFRLTLTALLYTHHLQLTFCWTFIQDRKTGSLSLIPLMIPTSFLSYYSQGIHHVGLLQTSIMSYQYKGKTWTFCLATFRLRVILRAKTKIPKKYTKSELYTKSSKIFMNLASVFSRIYFFDIFQLSAKIIIIHWLSLHHRAQMELWNPPQCKSYMNERFVGRKHVRSR